MITEKNFLKRLLKLLRPENIPFLDETYEDITICKKPHISAGWWESTNKGVYILSFTYQTLDKFYGTYENEITFDIDFRCVPFAATTPIYKHGKFVSFRETPAQKLFDKVVIKIVKEEIKKRLLEIEKGEKSGNGEKSLQRELLTTNKKELENIV